MISQNWLKNEHSCLASITHWPHQKPIGGVILMAGFGSPMCDLDYFISKLSRRLCNSGFFILQFDPTGHGDSSGNLEDLNLEILKNDVRASINYMKSQISESVFCIGRGLAATILAEEKNKSQSFEGLVGINPYIINRDTFIDLSREVDESKDYELASLFEGTDYFKNSDFNPIGLKFIEQLGANFLNLHGQLMSGRFLNELFHYETEKIVESCDKDCLIAISSTSDDLEFFDFKNNIDFHKLFGLQNRELTHNPVWQHNLIEKIVDWIKTGITV